MENSNDLSEETKKCLKNLKEFRKFEGYDSMKKEVFLKNPMYCNNSNALYAFLLEKGYIEELGDIISITAKIL